MEHYDIISSIILIRKFHTNLYRSHHLSFDYSSLNIYPTDWLMEGSLRPDLGSGMPLPPPGHQEVTTFSDISIHPKRIGWREKLYLALKLTIFWKPVQLTKENILLLRGYITSFSAVAFCIELCILSILLW